MDKVNIRAGQQAILARERHTLGKDIDESGSLLVGVPGAVRNVRIARHLVASGARNGARLANFDAVAVLGCDLHSNWNVGTRQGLALRPDAIKKSKRRTGECS